MSLNIPFGKRTPYLDNYLKIPTKSGPLLPGSMATRPRVILSVLRLMVWEMTLGHSKWAMALQGPPGPTGGLLAGSAGEPVARALRGPFLRQTDLEVGGWSAL